MENVNKSRGELVGEKTFWKFSKELFQEIRHIIGLPFIEGIPVWKLKK